MIDVDKLEFCKYCDEPLIIIEDAMFTGHFNKVARVTKKLGMLVRAAGVPVVILTALYKPTADMKGIECLYIRKVDERGEWTKYYRWTWEQFHNAVLQIHAIHEQHCKGKHGSKEGKDHPEARVVAA